MQHDTQISTLAKHNLDKFQWVEVISLPIHGEKITGRSKSSFARLSRNYAFVKHMMNELGLKQNSDYLILRDYNSNHADTLEIAFNEQSQNLASMVLLIWPRYQHAKLESNI